MALVIDIFDFLLNYFDFEKIKVIDKKANSILYESNDEIKKLIFFYRQNHLKIGMLAKKVDNTKTHILSNNNSSIKTFIFFSALKIFNKYFKPDEVLKKILKLIIVMILGYGIIKFIMII